MTKDSNLRQTILHWLRVAYGEESDFREGQYEAIESVIVKRRTLVVEKTGWGKSLVYFMCTKYLREKGVGFTLIVSPLLALMDNQKDAAEKLGLKCLLLNSMTKQTWEDSMDEAEQGLYDLVFITPESLFKEVIQRRLPNLQIGLFVIDECHCISECGHDFRRDYCNLNQVIRRFSENVRLLATTATANRQVIEDLEEQLSQGRGKVHVVKGPLVRETLYIRVYERWSKAKRYAWILKNLPNLPGTGIIYCRTKFDCDDLSNFLVQNGIKACAYYSRSGVSEEEKNNRSLRLFRENEIKVLVSTVKLGMGYDKDDVAFVIHYQMPKSIVEYYQQIGRAGRKLKRAFAILLTGPEDEEINHYFIETAFPEQQEAEQVYEAIGNNEGITERGLLKKVNLGFGKISKIVHFLRTDGYIEETGSKLYQTPKIYVYDGDTYAKIKERRYQDLNQMEQIVNHQGCLQNYITQCLDDADIKVCGHCFNCHSEDFINFVDPSLEEIGCVQAMLDYNWEYIPPRRAVKLSNGHSWQSETIICASRYGEPRYGIMVKEDKYSTNKRFRDELVEHGKKILQSIINKEGIEFVTCVPSLRSDLVREYTVRLAKMCGIKFIDCLEKNSLQQQKDMQNSQFQQNNAMNSFSIVEGIRVPKKVILVDDVVDSRWTLTACGIKLAEAGCEQVFPFVLANAGVGDS